ncbi:MAG: O-antigen ligase family protein [Patescibacteria group bacterium]
MAKYKKINIVEKLMFLYFVLFPFGHLLTLRLSILGKLIPLNVSDLISVVFLIIFFVKKVRYPTVYIYFKNFLILAVFSQIFFIARFGITNSIIGNLYLLRLISYTAMFIVIWNYVLENKKVIDRIFDYLIIVSFFIAIFGWLQYLIYPDLRSLIALGWDDHLFRIVGTFIDPTFTAILLVFGFLLSLIKYQKTKKNIYVLALVPILLALYFTYSRAGYLSLIAGVLTYLFIKKKIKISFIVIPIFLLGLILLPRPSSEGVHLERTFSIKAKVTNYYETSKIFLKNPIFGIGYNNLCWARSKYLDELDTDSHSCSGSDSGILLLLATTGVVGFLIFISFLYMIVKTLKTNYCGIAFISCFSALVVHSQFSNSIFYPWVIGFFVFLSAVSIKE